MIVYTTKCDIMKTTNIRRKLGGGLLSAVRSAYILFEDGSDVNRGVNIDFCVSNVLSAEIQKEGAERIPPLPSPLHTAGR
jgi:hypothetical protein